MIYTNDSFFPKPLLLSCNFAVQNSFFETQELSATAYI